MRPALRLAWVGVLSLASAAIAADATLSGRAEIVDGDTLRIGGVGVRLKGISAPERNERGGKAARDALVRMIGDQPTVCHLTGETTRNRAVGYCEVGGRDLQAELVRQGYAMACPRFDERYVPLEADPRARKAGVWGMGYELPAYCVP